MEASSKETDRVAVIDLDFDAACSSRKHTGRESTYKSSKNRENAVATYWSQNGKASSLSLPMPAIFFFCAIMTGLLMDPWRSPEPLPCHPWETRYACPSIGMLEDE